MDYEAYSIIPFITVAIIMLLAIIVPVIFFIWLFNRNKKREELPQYVFYGLSEMKPKFNSLIDKLNKTAHTVNAKHYIKSKKDYNIQYRKITKTLIKFMKQKSKEGEYSGTLRLTPCYFPKQSIKEIIAELGIGGFSISEDYLDLRKGYAIILDWRKDA